MIAHHEGRRPGRGAEWQDVYAGRIRAIEELYDDVHTHLLEWGRWGRERFPGKPRLMLCTIWVMQGDPDPNRDPTAPPPTRMPPFDELRVQALDVKINDLDFPTVWCGILSANYVRRIPEYQRPTEANIYLRRTPDARARSVRLDPENYIAQLSNALDFLRG